MYCLHKSNNSIKKIHERALRIAYGYYASNFDTLLENDSSIPIHQRNIQTQAAEVSKTKNDLNPSFMTDIFNPVIHSHITRNHNLSYPNPKTVSYGLETFGYRANLIWNSLPSVTQSAVDLKTFNNLFPSTNKNLCSCNLCKVIFHIWATYKNSPTLHSSHVCNVNSF